MDWSKIIERAGSKAKLAKICGVTQQMVGNWTLHNKPMSPEKFYKLQEVMPDLVDWDEMVSCRYRCLRKKWIE